MIYGNIENKDTFDQLLGKAVWDKAFNFLLHLPESPSLGIRLYQEMCGIILLSSIFVSKNEAKKQIEAG